MKLGERELAHATATAIIGIDIAVGWRGDIFI